MGRKKLFNSTRCCVQPAELRTPKGFGLEELGIPISPKRTIETDEWLQTLYPNIYACGDVSGPYQFTHVAAHQGWYASVNALFGAVKRFKVDYSVIPWATFTDPEVARAGLSENEAKKQDIAYEVTRYSLQDLDRAITDEAAHGFVKLLTVPGKDRILGVTIVGDACQRPSGGIRAGDEAGAWPQQDTRHHPYLSYLAGGQQICRGGMETHACAPSPAGLGAKIS